MREILPLCSAALRSSRGIRASPMSELLPFQEVFDPLQEVFVDLTGGRRQGVPPHSKWHQREMIS